MTRLLAAVGLAAVVCLALVLSACTDGVSSPDENPLSDRSDTASGSVIRSGFPEREASVIIWYWDGDESSGSWEIASLFVGLSDMGGGWMLPYIYDARGQGGYAYGSKYIGQELWEGTSDEPYYYPSCGGEVTGIEIELFLVE